MASCCSLRLDFLQMESLTSLEQVSYVSLSVHGTVQIHYCSPMGRVSPFIFSPALSHRSRHMHFYFCIWWKKKLKKKNFLMVLKARCHPQDSHTAFHILLPGSWALFTYWIISRFATQRAWRWTNTFIVWPNQQLLRLLLPTICLAALHLLIPISGNRKHPSVNTSQHAAPKLFKVLGRWPLLLDCKREGRTDALLWNIIKHIH